jgi:monofunctional biosynthetic peptidoglycan transglycosylase
MPSFLRRRVFRINSKPEARRARALASLLSAASVEASSPFSALPAGLGPFPAEPPGRQWPAGRLKRAARAIGLLLLALQLSYIAATSLLIVAYRRVDPSVTVLMAYRRWIYGWSLEAPRPGKLGRLPSFVRSMLVAVEDGKFYTHHGLDFEAFERALKVNAQVGRPLYGGSTLTMQLARTLFLVPEKSYLRKYLEVIAALELELFLSKSRIHELYFGYAEWGKGIFGIEAAARHWYGKRAAALTRDEAARLIALLSSPIKYGPGTLQRSGILRDRYAYLSNRFDTAASAPDGTALKDSGEKAAEAIPPEPLPTPEGDPALDGVAP